MSEEKLGWVPRFEPEPRPRMKGKRVLGINFFLSQHNNARKCTFSLYKSDHRSPEERKQQYSVTEPAPKRNRNARKLHSGLMCRICEYWFFGAGRKATLYISLYNNPLCARILR